MHNFSVKKLCLVADDIFGNHILIKEKGFTHLHSEVEFDGTKRTLHLADFTRRCCEEQKAVIHGMYCNMAFKPTSYRDHNEIMDYARREWERCRFFLQL